MTKQHYCSNMAEDSPVDWVQELLRNYLKWVQIKHNKAVKNVFIILRITINVESMYRVIQNFAPLYPARSTGNL